MTTAPILAHLAAAVMASSVASPDATAAVLAQIQQSEGHYHEGELGEMAIADFLARVQGENAPAAIVAQ